MQTASLCASASHYCSAYVSVSDSRTDAAQHSRSYASSRFSALPPHGSYVVVMQFFIFLKINNSARINDKKQVMIFLVRRFMSLEKGCCVNFDHGDGRNTEYRQCPNVPWYVPPKFTEYSFYHPPLVFSLYNVRIKMGFPSW